VCKDCLSFLIFLLAGVTPEGDRTLPIGIAMTKELLELPELAVRQGVHGIDDDGLYSAAGSVSEHVIHDGDDVCEAFS